MSHAPTTKALVAQERSIVYIYITRVRAPRFIEEERWQSRKGQKDTESRV